MFGNRRAVALTARIILSVFIYSFVLQEPVSAALAVAGERRSAEEIRGKIDGLLLPYRYGRIVSGRYSNPEKLVVYIQDLHCNPEVQRNIYEIISLLDKKLGVDKILVEGAPAGEAGTGLLGEISDESFRKTVLNALLEKGLISGAEYYSALENKNILFGLENWAVYSQNRERIQRLIERKADNEETARALRRRVSGLSARYQSGKLKKIEKRLALAFAEGTAPEKKYRELEEMGRKAGEALNDYPEFEKYRRIVKLNKEIKFKRLAGELADYINELKKTVPFNVYNILAQKLQEGSQEEYYYGIWELSRIYLPGIESRYPNASGFLEYVRLNYTINPVDLVREEKIFRERIEERSASTLSDKETVFLSKMAEILENMAGLKVTARELEYFKANREDFLFSLRKYFSADELARAFGLLSDGDLREYYETNIARNDIFTSAICGLPPRERGRETGRSAAAGYKSVLSNISGFRDVEVVLTGGFHSGITNGIDNSSYISITPNATQNHDESVYESLMSQRIGLAEIASAAFSPENFGQLEPRKQMEMFVGAVLHEAQAGRLSLSDALSRIKNQAENSAGKHGVSVAIEPKGIDFIIAIDNGRWQLKTRRGEISGVEILPDAENPLRAKIPARGKIAKGPVLKAFFLVAGGIASYFGLSEIQEPLQPEFVDFAQNALLAPSLLAAAALQLSGKKPLTRAAALEKINRRISLARALGKPVVCFVAMEMPILGLKGEQGGGQGIYMKDTPAAQGVKGIGSFVFTPLFSKSVADAYGSVEEFMRKTGSVVLSELYVPVGRGSILFEVIYSEQENTGVPVLFLFNKDGEFFNELYKTPPPNSLGGFIEAIALPRASLMIQQNLGIEFDAMHFNDWQTALGPVYLEEEYKNSNWQLGRRPASVFTVHNLEHQGIFPRTMDIPHRADSRGGLLGYLFSRGVLGEHRGYDDREMNAYRSKETGGLVIEMFKLTGLGYSAMDLRKEKNIEYWEKQNLMKGAITYSDRISFVSRGHLLECLTPERGYGMNEILLSNRNKLAAVHNGVMARNYLPENSAGLKKDGFVSEVGSDPLAWKEKNKAALQKLLGLDEDPSAMVLGLAGRVVKQKGLSVLITRLESGKTLLEELLDYRDPESGAKIQVPIMGKTGDERGREIQEELFRIAGNPKYKGQLVVVNESDYELFQRFGAGSNQFLMPSIDEPGGIANIEMALKLALVIVTDRGGLKDFYLDGGTPFKPVPGFEDTDELDEPGRVASAKAIYDIATGYLKTYADKAAYRAALEKLRKFNPDWVESGRVDEYERIYNETIRGNFNSARYGIGDGAPVVAYAEESGRSKEQNRIAAMIQMFIRRSLNAPKSANIEALRARIKEMLSRAHASITPGQKVAFRQLAAGVKDGTRDIFELFAFFEKNSMLGNLNFVPGRGESWLMRDGTYMDSGSHNREVIYSLNRIARGDYDHFNNRRRGPEEMRRGDFEGVRKIYGEIVSEPQDLLTLWLFAVLHDYGKLMLGNHHADGAEIVPELLSALGVDSSQARLIAELIGRHTDFGDMYLGENSPDAMNASLKESGFDINKFMKMNLLINVADAAGLGEGKLGSAQLSEYLDIIDGRGHESADWGRARIPKLLLTDGIPSEVEASLNEISPEDKKEFFDDYLRRVHFRSEINIDRGLDYANFIKWHYLKALIINLSGADIRFTVNSYNSASARINEILSGVSISEIRNTLLQNAGIIETALASGQKVTVFGIPFGIINDNSALHLDTYRVGDYDRNEPVKAAGYALKNSLFKSPAFGLPLLAASGDMALISHLGFAALLLWAVYDAKDPIQKLIETLENKSTLWAALPLLVLKSLLAVALTAHDVIQSVGNRLALASTALPKISAGLSVENVSKLSKKDVKKTAESVGAFMELKAMLKDADDDVVAFTIKEFGNISAAMIRRGENVDLSFLRKFSNDMNWNIRAALAEALFAVYSAQIERGEKPLTGDLMKMKNDQDSDVRRLVSALVIELKALEEIHGKTGIEELKSKLKAHDWETRGAAARALGKAYAEKIRLGESADFSDLEEMLTGKYVSERGAAARALGDVYLAMYGRGLITQKELEKILEEKKENDWNHIAAIEPLLEIYIENIQKGLYVDLNPLRAVFQGGNWPEWYAAKDGRVRLLALNVVSGNMALGKLVAMFEETDWEARKAGAAALGLVYRERNKKSQMSVAGILKKLKIMSWEHRSAGVVALGEIIKDRINQGYLTARDILKAEPWEAAGLSYEQKLFEEYFTSDDGKKYMNELKRRAEEAVQNGFDYLANAGRLMGFIGVQTAGVRGLTFQEYEGRLLELAEFDRKNPGYFKSMFSKVGAMGLKPIELSVNGTRELDISDVNVFVLEKNIERLEKFNIEVDNFSWVEWFKKDGIEDRTFNIRNVFYQVKRQEAVESGLVMEGDRFSVEFPSVEGMQDELWKNPKLYYRELFRLAYRRMGDRESQAKCLALMRDLVISDILLDQGLAGDLYSDNIETRINAFKIFYEDYKTHLPLSVGLTMDNLKGLQALLDELSSEVFGEIAKTRIVRGLGRESYRLEPEGFLSVFRGKAGIIDCSFDMDKGVPFTRAMHEDTIYYHIYKGKELKGYVGLMITNETGMKLEKDGSASQRKILLVDTIQSPSIDGEPLLINLFSELDKLAKKLGCVGIALPNDLKGPFNFGNKDTIRGMKSYRNAAVVELLPYHKASWDKFTELFKSDKYNSIDAPGAFRLMSSRTIASEKKTILSTTPGILNAFVPLAFAGAGSWTLAAHIAFFGLLLWAVYDAKDPIQKLIETLENKSTLWAVLPRLVLKSFLAAAVAAHDAILSVAKNLGFNTFSLPEFSLGLRIEDVSKKLKKRIKARPMPAKAKTAKGIAAEYDRAVKENGLTELFEGYIQLLNVAPPDKGAVEYASLKDLAERIITDGGVKSGADLGSVNTETSGTIELNRLKDIRNYDTEAGLVELARDLMLLGAMGKIKFRRRIGRVISPRNNFEGIVKKFEMKGVRKAYIPAAEALTLEYRARGIDPADYKGDENQLRFYREVFGDSVEDKNLGALYASVPKEVIAKLGWSVINLNYGEAVKLREAAGKLYAGEYSGDANQLRFYKKVFGESVYSKNLWSLYTAVPEEIIRKLGWSLINLNYGEAEKLREAAGKEDMSEYQGNDGQIRFYEKVLGSSVIGKYLGSPYSAMPKDVVSRLGWTTINANYNYVKEIRNAARKLSAVQYWGDEGQLRFYKEFFGDSAESKNLNNLYTVLPKDAVKKLGWSMMSLNYGQAISAREWFKGKSLKDLVDNYSSNRGFIKLCDEILGESAKEKTLSGILSVMPKWVKDSRQYLSWSRMQLNYKEAKVLVEIGLSAQNNKLFIDGGEYNAKFYSGFEGLERLLIRLRAEKKIIGANKEVLDYLICVNPEIRTQLKWYRTPLLISLFEQVKYGDGTTAKINLTRDEKMPDPADQADMIEQYDAVRTAIDELGYDYETMMEDVEALEAGELNEARQWELKRKLELVREKIESNNKSSRIAKSVSFAGLAFASAGGMALLTHIGFAALFLWAVYDAKDPIEKLIETLENKSTLWAALPRLVLKSLLAVAVTTHDMMYSLSTPALQSIWKNLGLTALKPSFGFSIDEIRTKTVSPMADALLSSGLPGNLKEEIINSEQQYKFVDPIGLEVEFKTENNEHPGSFVGIAPDDMDQEKMFYEYPFKPSSSYRVQELALNELNKNKKIRDIVSVQVNMGIPYRRYRSVIKEPFESDARLLMYGIVMSYVSDERIRNKKTSKVANILTNERLSRFTASDDSKTGNKQDYYRVEYGYGDIENADRILPAVQLIHAVISNHYLGDDEYLNSVYLERLAPLLGEWGAESITKYFTIHNDLLMRKTFKEEVIEWREQHPREVEIMRARLEEIVGDVKKYIEGGAASGAASGNDAAKGEKESISPRENSVPAEKWPMADGVDIEHITAIKRGIISPAQAAYCVANRNKINPQGLPLRGIYGASGPDMTTALLSTDASEMMFVDLAIDPESFNADNLNRIKSGKYGEIESKYFKELLSRFLNNLWNRHHIEKDFPSLVVLDLKMLGVDAKDINFSRNSYGNVELTFPWAYPGEKARERKITFVKSDITYPGEYNAELSEFLNSRPDFYYQKSALTLKGRQAADSLDQFIEVISDKIEKFILVSPVTYSNLTYSYWSNITRRWSEGGRGYRMEQANRDINDKYSEYKDSLDQKYGWYVELWVKQKTQGRAPAQATENVAAGEAIRPVNVSADTLAPYRLFPGDSEIPMEVFTGEYKKYTDSAPDEFARIAREQVRSGLSGRNQGELANWIKVLSEMENDKLEYIKNWKGIWEGFECSLFAERVQGILEKHSLGYRKGVSRNIVSPKGRNLYDHHYTIVNISGNEYILDTSADQFEIKAQTRSHHPYIYHYLGVVLLPMSAVSADRGRFWMYAPEESGTKLAGAFDAVKAAADSVTMKKTGLSAAAEAATAVVIQNISETRSAAGKTSILGYLPGQAGDINKIQQDIQRRSVFGSGAIAVSPGLGRNIAGVRDISDDPRAPRLIEVGMPEPSAPGGRIKILSEIRYRKIGNGIALFVAPADIEEIYQPSLSLEKADEIRKAIDSVSRGHSSESSDDGALAAEYMAAAIAAIVEQKNRRGPLEDWFAARGLGGDVWSVETAHPVISVIKPIFFAAGQKERKIVIRDFRGALTRETEYFESMARELAAINATPAEGLRKSDERNGRQPWMTEPIVMFDSALSAGGFSGVLERVKKSSQSLVSRFGAYAGSPEGERSFGAPSIDPKNIDIAREIDILFREKGLALRFSPAQRAALESLRSQYRGLEKNNGAVVESDTLRSIEKIVSDFADIALSVGLNRKIIARLSENGSSHFSISDRKAELLENLALWQLVSLVEEMDKLGATFILDLGRPREGLEAARAIDTVLFWLKTVPCVRIDISGMDFASGASFLSDLHSAFLSEKVPFDRKIMINCRTELAGEAAKYNELEAFAALDLTEDGINGMAEKEAGALIASKLTAIKTAGASPYINTGRAGRHAALAMKAMLKSGVESAVFEAGGTLSSGDVELARYTDPEGGFDLAAIFEIIRDYTPMSRVSTVEGMFDEGRRFAAGKAAVVKNFDALFYRASKLFSDKKYEGPAVIVALDVIRDALGGADIRTRNKILIDLINSMHLEKSVAGTIDDEFVALALSDNSADEKLHLARIAGILHGMVSSGLLARIEDENGIRGIAQDERAALENYLVELSRNLVYEGARLSLDKNLPVEDKIKLLPVVARLLSVADREREVTAVYEEVKTGGSAEMLKNFAAAAAKAGGAPAEIANSLPRATDSELYLTVAGNRLRSAAEVINEIVVNGMKPFVLVAPSEKDFTAGEIADAVTVLGQDLPGMKKQEFRDMVEDGTKISAEYFKSMLTAG